MALALTPNELAADRPRGVTLNAIWSVLTRIALASARGRMLREVATLSDDRLARHGLSRADLVARADETARRI